LISVVDWDQVFPVPLTLSAMALGTKLFEYCRAPHHTLFLNSGQEDEFQQHLARIERERSNSSILSTFYNESSENFFLYLLLEGFRWTDIEMTRPKVFAEALKRTPESLLDARREWETFKRIFFTNQGRPVPFWPAYLEIERDLGIIGNSQYVMKRLGLELKFQNLLVPVLRRITMMFPGSNWAKEIQCYFQAAGWHEYRLPNGKYSCIS
jgi:hypothetical protein